MRLTARSPGATGIVQAIDVMRISRYSYSDPGYRGTDACPPNQNSWVNGNCSDWGNTMGEIFLEALRYFVAGTSPNSNFTSNNTTWISNLTSPSWVNPWDGVDHARRRWRLGLRRSPTSWPSPQVLQLRQRRIQLSLGIPGLRRRPGRSDGCGGQQRAITRNSWYISSVTSSLPTDVCSTRTVSNLTRLGICRKLRNCRSSRWPALPTMRTCTLCRRWTASDPDRRHLCGVAGSAPTLSDAVAAVGRTVTVIPARYDLRNSDAMQLNQPSG